MQDLKQKEQNPGGLKEAIWRGIALLIFGIGLAIFWSIIQRAPQSEWRNAFSRFPWKAAGVELSEGEASWKKSAGDARMELRSYCFPVCRIKLNEATGSGAVTALFYDETGTVIGDRVVLPYKDGQFTPQNSASIQTNGNEATFRLEDGFKNRELYTLHQANQQEQLWRVVFDCRPEGQSPETLGHLSILPHDL